MLLLLDVVLKKEHFRGGIVLPFEPQIHTLEEVTLNHLVSIHTSERSFSSQQYNIY